MKLPLPKLHKSKKKQSPEDLEIAKARSQAAQYLGSGMVDVQDVIAPPGMEVDFDFVRIGDTYFRTLFVTGYPRFVGANWLSPLINFDHTLDISFYYYPVETKGILGDLRRKIAEMEATIESDLEAGRVLDPSIRAALGDAQELQEQLATGIERFFQFSFYIKIPAENLEELNSVTKQVEAVAGSLLILTKHSTLQQEQGFQTTLPYFSDKLYVVRNMDTTSLAASFPFTSSELTSNEGILYGMNEHNGSLVIFDRFALENYNSVIFAKSGAGKSYLVKLEALRSLMFGTEIIIIDLEDEYKDLALAIGGQYVKFAQNQPAKINPFDLSGVYEQGENDLGLKILSLHTLLKVMLGEMNESEDSVLDHALVETYKLKGITPDPSTYGAPPPVMGDLYNVLSNMADPAARSLAQRLEKFIKGSLSGIFDQPSTVDLTNTFIVFSIRELEDELRSIAMFIILDYVWTRVKRDKRKRLLVVDEAWYLMRYTDSASFLYSIAKRARKYNLGLTTITQDVGDFLNTEHGKAVVNNSSIQVLLKQNPAAIETVSSVFYLTEGERNLLLSANVGEGLFFVGTNHVAIRITASADEHTLLTQGIARFKEETGKKS